MKPGRIIISRIDSIGDVILTLPIAGFIKEKYPDSTLIFLGRSYTKPVVSLSKYIDEFANWDDITSAKNPTEQLKALHAEFIIHVFPVKEVARLAFKAGIPYRIGTNGRLYHFLNCNRKVVFSRRKSDLHEAQLNLKLLAPLLIDTERSTEDVIERYGFENIPELPERFKAMLDSRKKNIILHPKSQGSAKEWGLNNFSELIKTLPSNDFKIFITGTEKEGELIGDELPFNQSNVVSLLGEMTLDELIAFIAAADGIVAASTGPLHIASALGRHAFGLYSVKRPIHPGRWAPLGKNAHVIVNDPNCPECTKGNDCNCIAEISPKKVAEELISKLI